MLKTIKYNWRYIFSTSNKIATLFFSLWGFITLVTPTDGILYSIAETTKANGLKPYEYFKYLLEELLAHENEITDELIDRLLPWSETIPEEIKAKV